MLGKPRYNTIIEFIEDIDFTTPLHVPGGSLTGDDDKALAALSDVDLFMCEMARVIKKEKDIHRVDLIHRKMLQVTNQSHYGEEADAAILLRLSQWSAQISLEAQA